MRTSKMGSIIASVNLFLEIIGEDGRFLTDSSGSKKPAEGYLSIIRKEGGLLELKIPFIDDTPLADELKYGEFSEEKAHRLAVFYQERGHMSSFQSRDPEANLWGGAIVAGDYILSFSGLPEKTDEALMLLLAVKQGLMSMEAACLIAEASNNEAFRGMAFKVFSCRCQ